MTAHEKPDRTARYLRLILVCIQRIEEYTVDGYDLYRVTPMIRSAAERELEKLADATGKSPEALRARHQFIPWRRITGFRNILAHEYDSVDDAIVWAAINEGLPPLKKVVEEELGITSSDSTTDE